MVVPDESLESSNFFFFFFLPDVFDDTPTFESTPVGSNPSANRIEPPSALDDSSCTCSSVTVDADESLLFGSSTAFFFLSSSSSKSVTD
jgi:hypothetical protein